MNFARLVLPLLLFIFVSLPTQRLLAHSEPSPESPSQQPSYGPGGNQYSHDNVRVTFVPSTTALGYSRYEPTSPTPTSAPILVYLMFDAEDYYLPANVVAAAYDAMFKHIARKGYVVIFPSANFAGTSGHVFERAPKLILDTVRLALQDQELRTVKPRRDANGAVWAIGGHSRGGLYSVLVADRYQEALLTPPKVLILHESNSPEIIRALCLGLPTHQSCGFTFPSLFKNIPSTTRLVMIRSYENEARGRGQGETLPNGLFEVHAYADLWRRTLITESNAHFFYVQRDEHAGKVLDSAHVSVVGTSLPVGKLLGSLLSVILGGSVSGTDRVDWNGYWRPTVAALDLALLGDKGAEQYLSDGGRAAVEMGQWSDGTRALPLLTKRDFPGMFRRNQFSKPSGILSVAPGFPSARMKRTAETPNHETQFTVRNEGMSPVRILNIELSGASFHFGSAQPSCLRILNDHEFCQFELSYLGKGAESRQGVLRVVYEVAGNVFEIRRALIAD